MRESFIAIILILLPAFVSASTLNPPWKRVYKKPGYEFWYNTSSVKYFGQIIDVDVWEVRPESASLKRIRFDRTNGQVAIATAKGYKYDKLVADFDFTNNGYVYGKAYNEYRLLFKKLNAAP